MGEWFKSFRNLLEDDLDKEFMYLKILGKDRKDWEEGKFNNYDKLLK